MGGRRRRKGLNENKENMKKRSKSIEPSSTSTIDPYSSRFNIQNLAFDNYYKEQRIVTSQQWDSFLNLLRTPLPSSFRINSNTQFSQDIRSQLENDFVHSLRFQSVEEDDVDPVIPLPWYPENFAWQSKFSRMQLRKNQSLTRFHEFLKLQSEIGNITRQEAVSMVPPLFLDIHSNHFVLDMCAAPGSKTFQLLEIIHKSTEAGSLPDGMVIANDLDIQRCNLLIHQAKRLCTSNLIVTSHEAQNFPGCFLNRNYDAMEPDQNIDQLLFDRVLCDVPCSGDGTLRKAPELWRKWNTGTGNGLHNLQVLIVVRGLSLLKVGGRLVYSTCSMNPIENEAVVAEVLRRSGGSVELVDVSSELPQLIRRPGLKKWKVSDKGLWLVSCKDVPKSHRTVILPSMFPAGGSYQDAVGIGDDTTGDANGNSEDVQAVENPVMHEFTEEVSDFPLEHCMRLVPHDQNTGAFFIAVLQKVSPLPGANMNDNEPNAADSEVSPVTCEEGDSNGPQEPHDVENIAKITPGNRKLQSRGKWRGIDPVVFFKDEVIINSIKAFYGIDEKFPFDGHLVTRNSDTSHVKRIYYVSKSVKDVLELNFSVGQQLKITSVGLKIFERQTSLAGISASCAFRISSEGLPLVLPHITKQILRASPIDFKHLLQYRAVKFADFVDAEFGERAANLMPGCCVIVLGEGNRAPTKTLEVDKSTIAIGCWKGGATLTLMVTELDRQELLERFLTRLDTEKDSMHGSNLSDNTEDDVLHSNGKDDVEANGC
ncbi:PREDICTED: multisite-specific tRNA:(cytosine-C(5))-methyltransferase-like isoform X2 [Lupinus angustifolius]|uniref:multisite-specific tRNA:(cytosine-C(5))-methyltransferase-like isoform X2 n=1 Tax=Lupinus angustifolius TaxID=3871 RepID=UPI00092F40F7|nr:PREDICTED: multisite-specific tRNA:(cytosine-C(5))-methyltransferase-like isoform X2 [Lupinus angustifolius]